jgi:hypothetical protein
LPSTSPMWAMQQSIKTSFTLTILLGKYTYWGLRSTIISSVSGPNIIFGYCFQFQFNFMFSSFSRGREQPL